MKHPHHYKLLIFFTIIFCPLFLINDYCCLNVLSPSSSSSISILSNDVVHEINEWSLWSPWSPCSRICDGGITTSVRKCLARSGCKNGQFKRHKLCNMQPCIVKTNFRQSQCSSFNNKPYRERYYEWIAFIDPTDPCSLTCKANGLNFVAKLSPFITDGTRCTTDSLDVCVSGKCMSVGCDLQLGSTKKIDNCGVCGGDGSSCKNHTYRWQHRFETNCSTICSNDYQLSQFRTSTVFCTDVSTEIIVDDLFCRQDERPNPITSQCESSIEHCKFRWITEEWSKCSQKCGTGYQIRAIYCVLNINHNVKMDEKQCEKIGLKRPETERKCNEEECPEWYEGPWSACSETCGNGTQKRHVICKDNQGLPSDKCDWQLRPLDSRNCSDISDCLNGKSTNSQEDSPNNHIVIDSMINEPSYDVGQWSSCNVTCGIGYKKRSVKCRIYLEFSKTFATIPFNQCSGSRPSDIQICYGYDCHMDGKDSLQENNYIIEPDDNFIDEKFQWKITGFTKCSANCLGGTQESIIDCIRISDNQRMPTELCPLETKPETYTRICNDQPCLPRWNLSEFGDCSKKCGEGGYQTRVVLCIHEVARGSKNFVIVPDDQCDSLKPLIERKCNQFDCPARWDTHAWQKCSRECGGGLKKRNIYCVKDYVIGGLQNVSFVECSLAKKPKISKQCNLKPCRRTSSSSSSLLLMGNNGGEMIRKSKRNHHNNRLNNHQIQYKHVFKVQGEVTIMEGSRIKLLCPLPLQTTTTTTTEIKPIWLKGHDIIQSDRKHIIMMDNFLKIRMIKSNDTGVYKCIYNYDSNNDDDIIQHSMFLHVVRLMDNNNNNDFMNDQHSTTTTTTTTTEISNNYYQNELDVSQEMEKYSLKSETKRQYLSYDNNDDNDNDRIRPDRLGGIQELIALVRKSNKKSSQSPQLSLVDNSNEINDEKQIIEKPYGQLNWITTSWSNCTIPCGGFGFKIRHSQCYERLDNMTRKLNDSFCIESGLTKPNTFEICGLQTCSYWMVGQWSECQGCIDIHKGIQWRNVECHNQNGTINMDESECYHWNSNKPITQQECYHMNCIPMWKIFNKTIQHSLTEIEKEESFDLNERKVCFSFDL
ncbi:Thrombospondin type 1 repeat protein [Dermatophagoides pteronyssinus]|uniref:Thrombospondin type 1 repeat protein n=1 Tax=Dermatophagoides pteronyssinus TaxID=6956 RepID=A0ABQ8J3L6_DERPT|nr:Thrombospondin type 1 repeat protein [Dermatophagoides pteronyssinus]